MIFLLLVPGYGSAVTFGAHSDIKFSLHMPICIGMNTTISHAQAEAILDAAKKLFDLIVQAKHIDAGSPDGIELHSEIVYGALWRAAPSAAMESLYDRLPKLEAGH
ncbi:hypothetical protein AB4Y42_02435 [Paraburkholderia sp. EG286B]|uniref:hypothetical protein n=1 Tax=Paraburkholderia sp. EG286B TaxID=3237011 RepID=UPI0034D3401F